MPTIKSNKKLSVSHKELLNIELCSLKWHDAYVKHAWIEKEDVDDDYFCETFTAGFFIKKTKRHYVVALSLGCFGNAGDVIYIPTKMVQEVKFHGKIFKSSKSPRKR